MLPSTKETKTVYMPLKWVIVATVVWVTFGLFVFAKREYNPMQ